MTKNFWKKKWGINCPFWCTLGKIFSPEILSILKSLSQKKVVFWMDVYQLLGFFSKKKKKNFFFFGTTQNVLKKTPAKNLNNQETWPLRRRFLRPFLEKFVVRKRVFSRTLTKGSRTILRVFLESSRSQKITFL